MGLPSQATPSRALPNSHLPSYIPASHWDHREATARAPGTTSKGQSPHFFTVARNLAPRNSGVMAWQPHCSKPTAPRPETPNTKGVVSVQRRAGEGKTQRHVGSHFAVFSDAPCSVIARISVRAGPKHSMPCGHQLPVNQGNGIEDHFSSASMLLLWPWPSNKDGRAVLALPRATIPNAVATVGLRIGASLLHAMFIFYAEHHP